MNAYNSQRVGAGTVAMGDRRRRARARARLGQDARAVRPADRRIPGPAMDARRHADAAHGVAADALRRRRARAGPTAAPSPIRCWRRRRRSSPPRAAIKIVNDALQMFGARGYSRDLPLERMARDVRMFTIGGGTAQVLRTLVASKMLGWKLPQTRDGYAAETLAARRRGVTMHPIFATAGEAGGADPVRHRRQFRRRRSTKLDDRERALRAGRRLRAQARAGICWCRRQTANSPACCSASKTPTSRPRTCSGRARWPGCCRPASIASPMRRTMRGWRRSPLRSAPISSPATARREARNVRLVVPDGVDGEDLSRIVEGVDAGARPHQHAVERHGAGRAGRRGPQRSPSSTAPRSTVTERRQAGQGISRWSTRSARARRARRG